MGRREPGNRKGTRSVRGTGKGIPLPVLAAWGMQWGVRLLTGGLRTLPHFVIIGAQRCGTTSLYNYLSEHPGVVPAFMKETHFFDSHYGKGLNWYRAYFPFSRSVYHGRSSGGAGRDERAGREEDERGQRNRITGESTPYYLFHPHVPERVWRSVPGARLIVLLRNPVDRAYSHYHHEVSTGAETLSFEGAIDREREILPGEAERMLKDERYRSFAHFHHSYLARGIYVEQLQRWSGFFPREQMLILKSEDLYADPAATLSRVLEFLDLPEWMPARFDTYNLAHYTDMNADTRKRLGDFFAPHNQRLCEYLGADPGWGD